MINNDSIVTAYDEHLTLVEWLQKIEKLLANGGLKSTTLNDKGNATFSLTLTFNDNTTITSPDMTLTSVNEALTALTGDVQYLLKNKGVILHLPISEMEGVRLGNALDIDNKTLPLQGDSITLATQDEYNAVKNIILEAIRYGYVIVYDSDICFITHIAISDGNFNIICNGRGVNSGGIYEVDLTSDRVLKGYNYEI